MTDQRRYFRLMLLMSPIPALLMLGVSLLWRMRFPLGGNYVYLGMLQGDQPAYTALARAVFSRGNGLFYSNPFDYDPAAPRVLTNLGYIMLGWLIRLCGNHAVIAWEIWRAAWGTAAFALWGALVNSLLRGRGMRWWAWLAGGLGGGVAWVGVLWACIPFFGFGWLEDFIAIERSYGWWCLNLFRQALYPLELCYHAFFLGTVLLYLRGRLGWLVALLGMLWWLHPITSILACSIILAALFLDFLDRRQRELRRANAIAIAAIALLVLGANYYYRVFLTSYVSVAEWIHQTLEFNPHLAARNYMPAYGVLLLLVPCGMLFPRMRHWLWRERAGRLTALWGLFVLLWSNNHIFLKHAIQPLHFMRGHFYMFLILILARTLDLYRHDIRAHLAWTRRKALTVAAVLLLLLVPDNLLFLGRLALEPPQRDLLFISRGAYGVLDYFKTHTASGTRVIASFDQRLGVLLVMQGERVFVSEDVLTPFGALRLEIENSAIIGGTKAAKQVGITTIVDRDETGNHSQWATGGQPLKATYQNGQYQVYELP